MSSHNIWIPAVLRSLLQPLHTWPLWSYPWLQPWIPTAISLLSDWAQVENISQSQVYWWHFIWSASCIKLSEAHSVLSPCSIISLPKLHHTKPNWRRCEITNSYKFCLKKIISLWIIHTSHTHVKKTNRFSQFASVYLLSFANGSGSPGICAALWPQERFWMITSLAM